MLTVSEDIAEDGPGVAWPVFVIDTLATGPTWLYCYIDILHTAGEANQIHMLLLFVSGAYCHPAQTQDAGGAWLHPK